jgi:hypothetical protein
MGSVKAPCRRIGRTLAGSTWGIPGSSRSNLRSSARTSARFVPGGSWISACRHSPSASPSASPCAPAPNRYYAATMDDFRTDGITYGRLLDRDRVILGVLMDSFGGD